MLRFFLCGSMAANRRCWAVPAVQIWHSAPMWRQPWRRLGKGELPGWKWWFIYYVYYLYVAYIYISHIYIYIYICNVILYIYITLYRIIRRPGRGCCQGQWILTAQCQCFLHVGSFSDVGQMVYWLTRFVSKTQNSQPKTLKPKADITPQVNLESRIFCKLW